MNRRVRPQLPGPWRVEAGDEFGDEAESGKRACGGVPAKSVLDSSRETSAQSRSLPATTFAYATTFIILVSFAPFSLLLFVSLVYV